MCPLGRAGAQAAQDEAYARVERRSYACAVVAARSRSPVEGTLGSRDGRGRSAAMFSDVAGPPEDGPTDSVSPCTATSVPAQLLLDDEPGPR